jgi:hypothetical protein
LTASRTYAISICTTPLLPCPLLVMITLVLGLLGLSYCQPRPAISSCQLYLNPSYTTFMEEALPLSFSTVSCPTLEMSRPLTIVTVILEQSIVYQVVQSHSLFVTYPGHVTINYHQLHKYCLLYTPHN